MKLTTVPFFHALRTSDPPSELYKTTRVPWIGTKVTIIKFGDPLKGHPGVVKNVLCGQNTASGLRIEVQLARLNPSHPFKTVILDHDDIVESV